MPADLLSVAVVVSRLDARPARWVLRDYRPLHAHADTIQLRATVMHVSSIL